MKSLITLGILLVTPAAALAGTCTNSDDCAPDEECVAPACAECPPGEECEPCSGTGECMPVYSDGPSAVTSVECESDADCPSYFVCEELSLPCGGDTSTCACPDCDPASPDCPPCECDEAEPVECTPETQKLCTFVAVECASDSDCEEGFECYEETICMGGGCACPGCDPSSGEECPPCECDEEPMEEECQTVGAWCQPKQIACEAAADCPEGWECAEFSTGVSCACPACDCAEGTDCECPPCDCGDAEETTESVCMPGGWMELAQDGGIVGTRGPGGEVKYGEGDEEAATDALFPGGDPTGGGTGEGNGEGGGGGESAGEGGVDNGDGGGVSDDGSTDDGSGGCSATGGSSTWLALLSGLGVVALRRRGRREA